MPRAVFTAPDWQLRCGTPNWSTELPRGFSVRHAIEQLCRCAVYYMQLEASLGLNVPFPRIESEYDSARRLIALLQHHPCILVQEAFFDRRLLIATRGLIAPVGAITRSKGRHLARTNGGLSPDRAQAGAPKPSQLRRFWFCAVP